MLKRNSKLAHTSRIVLLTYLVASFFIRDKLEATHDSAHLLYLCIALTSEQIVSAHGLGKTPFAGWGGGSPL